MNVTEQILVQRELVSEDELEGLKHDATMSAKTIEEIVVEKKLMTEQTLYQAIAESANVLYIGQPYGIALDSSVLEMIHPDDMKKLKVIPVLIKDKGYLATVDIESQALINFLGKNYKGEYFFAIVTPVVYDKLYQKLVVPIKISEVSSNLEQTAEKTESHVVSLEESGKEIPDLLAMILTSAITRRASDIQFMPTESALEVYFKIDGDKYHFKTLSKSINDNIFRVIGKDAGMPEISITKPAVGKAQYNFNDEVISMRVSMIRTIRGIDINLRILDNTLPRIDTLGITDENISKLKRFMRLSKGLVLITGPTGSGKSTTMYSALVDVGVSDRTVISVEDPVEYVIDGCSQVEVNAKAGNTFESSVKAFLRHAPNVIILGEIRDKEVGTEAFRAAATGHLVLSTVHTNDAPSAITRLIDLGIAPYSIAESLAAVVAQRLIKRVCPHCAEDYTIKGSDTEYLEKGFKVGDTVKIAHGCEICNGTGYYGRMAINEILILDDTIRDMLDTGKGPTAIRRYIREDLRVPTLKDDAVRAVKEGKSTLQAIQFMFDEIL